MNNLNWIEKELCRRYLVGALLHVNKELRTDGFRKQAIIDATNVFINRLNELASVYDSGLGDHIGTDPVACRLCRREVEHHDLDVCIRCTMQKDEHKRLDIVNNLVDDLLDTRNSQERDDRKDQR